MSDGRRRLGAFGERVAAHHLEAHGYEIVARNWRCARGEIDLVAQRAGVTVFVEVKTRRSRDYGTPEQALTPHKARKLFELGQHYLLESDMADAEWRVDLIAVELDSAGKLLRCEQIENVVWGW